MINDKVLNRQVSIQQLLFIVMVALCATPLFSSPIALLSGVITALVIGNPFAQVQHKITNWLLQACVVALGFGINVHQAVSAGKQAFVFTIISISAVLVTGFFMGRLLLIDRKTAWMIAAGTAICGGSAIAAIAPAVKAEEKQISIALGTVFILNALALFVFPVVGVALHLTQTQFGWWCAIAIHDTSSVTGAAAHYGASALQLATTVKLARALWIIPVTLLSCILFKTSGHRIKIPWFILLFIIAMIASTYIPVIHNYGAFLLAPANAGLRITLFLIGAGLTKALFKQVGWQPFALGIVLWLAVSIISVWVIVLH